MIATINELKKKHNITIAAHYYQKDEVFECADLVGDSLELAKKSQNLNGTLVFCGVSFMGEATKILNPTLKVYMPRLGSCSMARMATPEGFDKAIEQLQQHDIDFIPVVYVNSTAAIKARVARLGGLTCTSSNAQKIVEWVLAQGKKVFFLPDKNLGFNIARTLNKTSALVGDGGYEKADIICYDGLCSVHQLFSVEDIEFYKEKFDDIVIAAHPEASIEVCKRCDFVGSTSQLLQYIENLPPHQKVAVGTEYNFIKRLKHPNTYVLSSTKPECASMNETTLESLYELMIAIDNNRAFNEIVVDPQTAQDAKIALERMMNLS
ncbi:MAG: quinolinate synthase NadA [Epsilonproteobacteria bacterium]|nr:quinolinate synthase NadA [Campylobacterota bacterium]